MAGVLADTSIWVAHFRQPNSRLAALLADDQVMTVIALFSREERPRNARQIELVAAVAAQLGEVLRRKQAEAAQAQRLHEVTALVDLSAALQLELSTDEMTATLARHAETALGADSVVIMVRDVTDDLVVRQGRGQAESLVGRRFALEEMPAFCSLHVLSLIHISEPTRPY